VNEEKLDYGAIKRLPGICGYIVKSGDTLWDIAKRYYTTIERIMETNKLASESLKPGMKLLITRTVM
jgi:nucleoid-associated protein YgaU